MREEDPEWAHEILGELYDSVYRETQRQISDHGLMDPMDPHIAQIDLFGPAVETPEVNASVIRGIARRLGQPIPTALMGAKSDILSRLIDRAPDVVDLAVSEAKMDFQRPGGRTSVYIRVTRNSISIERVTPHRIPY